MTTAKKTGAKKKTEERYWERVGRRKTVVARVRLFEKGTGIMVNGKDYTAYFPQEALQRVIRAASGAVEEGKSAMRATVHVAGGGIHAQAHAIRHGIARALVLYDEQFRKALRDAGYLTRDPRMKERRKFGLRKARRAPQWSKR